MLLVKTIGPSIGPELPKLKHWWRLYEAEGDDVERSKKTPQHVAERLSQK
jgi:hypothetical protein